MTPVASGGLVEEVAICGDGAQGQRPHAGEPHLHEPGESHGFHSESFAGFQAEPRGWVLLDYYCNTFHVEIGYCCSSH